MACQPPSCPHCAHGWMITLSSFVGSSLISKCFTYKKTFQKCKEPPRSAVHSVELVALCQLFASVVHSEVEDSRRLGEVGGQQDGESLVRRHSSSQAGEISQVFHSQSVTTNGEVRRKDTGHTSPQRSKTCLRW